MIQPSPGSKRSRLVAAGVVLALAAGASVVAGGDATASDKLKHRQHQVHGQVARVQSDLDDSSSALRSAQARLRSSRAALVVSQRRLSVAVAALGAAQRLDEEMQARLQQAESSLAHARDQLALAQQAVADERAAIGELAASNYANGDPALMGLAVIFKTQDPAAVTSQLNTVSSLMSKETMMLTRLREAKARTAAEEVLVAKATSTVAAQRKLAATNLVRKQALERSAALARSQYAATVTSNRAAALAASRIRAADLRRLHVLKQQERRIKDLIIQRSRRQHGGYTGGTGGFLFRPVPGYITSPYGWRIHPIYHYWGLHDGTDFAAPCGTPLRAAGSGTVITETWSDVYGHRLYLDLGRVNGKNMTVVYNHAISYRVGTGAHVRRGETVGYAGTTGWSTGCHLHFTVLVDGNPVNPMNYIG